ncbi:MAG: hypothetical protein ABI706_08635 [Ilumatobacteraceae bacterium]
MTSSNGQRARRVPRSGGRHRSTAFARLNSARRRQRVLRFSVAVGATAIVLVVGLIVLTRPSDDSAAPSGSSPTISAPATTTTAAPTTTASTLAPLALTYTLSGVEGLGPIDEPALTHVSSYTSMVAAWSTGSGVTEGYLVLTETFAPKWTAPEGYVTSVSIDVPDGHAFLVADKGFESLTSATRIMWLHSDGRLWTVSNFGLTPERLKALTLAILPGSGLPYVLPDPSRAFIGLNTAEAYQSVRQDWTLDQHFLELGVFTGGLAQQLADAVPVSVVERTIAGAQGYVISMTNGQVKLVWPTGDGDHWGSLQLNPALAGRLDEIVAAITPR